MSVLCLYSKRCHNDPAAHLSFYGYRFKGEAGQVEGTPVLEYIGEGNSSHHVFSLTVILSYSSPSPQLITHSFLVPFFPLCFSPTSIYSLRPLPSSSSSPSPIISFTPPSFIIPSLLPFLNYSGHLLSLLLLPSFHLPFHLSPSFSYFFLPYILFSNIPFFISFLLFLLHFFLYYSFPLVISSPLITFPLPYITFPSASLPLHPHAGKRDSGSNKHQN